MCGKYTLNETCSKYVLVEELRNMIAGIVCQKVLYTIIVDDEMKYNCSVV